MTQLTPPIVSAKADPSGTEVFDAALVAPPAERPGIGLRMLAAGGVMVLLGGVAAMVGMFWLLMAGFASDSHSGSLPDSLGFIFLGELCVLGVMVIVPPSLIVAGCRWWIALATSIGAVVLGVAGSFALFVTYAIVMSQ